MNLKQFVNKYRIRIENTWIDQNPNNPEWKDAYHYKTTLKMGRRRMTVYFSQGYGHTSEPEAVNVLGCLISDSWGIDQDFESWAQDLGYDADSRKAEKIFKQCQKQTAKLEKFLGPDLFHKARYDVEAW